MWIWWVMFIPFLEKAFLCINIAWNFLCVSATSKIKFEGRNMNPLQGNVHYEIIATIIFKGFQILWWEFDGDICSILRKHTCCVNFHVYLQHQKLNFWHPGGRNMNLPKEPQRKSILSWDKKDAVKLYTFTLLLRKHMTVASMFWKKNKQKHKNMLWTLRKFILEIF